MQRLYRASAAYFKFLNEHRAWPTIDDYAELEGTLASPVRHEAAIARLVMREEHDHDQD